MDLKPVLIQASARSQGDTSTVSQFLNKNYGFDILDLKSLNINPFDYDEPNQKDDFMPTINKLINDYNCWIFLSPVYWYSTSGRMKVFFDRISDLLKWNKDQGRKIRTKGLSLISVSNDLLMNPYYDTPTRLSADYLSMMYLGHHHVIVNNRKISIEEGDKLRKHIDALIKDWRASSH